MVRFARHDNQMAMQAPDLGRHYGGAMRIRRSIIISAILALSAAGSIAAGSAAPAVGAQGSAVHAVAMAPGTWVHG